MRERNRENERDDVNKVRGWVEKRPVPRPTVLEEKKNMITINWLEDDVPFNKKQDAKAI